MKFRVFLLTSCLSSFSLLLSLPGLTQRNPNQLLQRAICEQNWPEAISAIEDMKRLAPQQASRLTVYQSRLQTLANRGVYVEDWNCSQGGLPSPSQASTTSTPSESESQGQVYEIPILARASGIPVVEVTFNDTETYKMLFDTGASKTKILPSMARQLNLQSEGQGVVAVADGRFVPVNLSRVNTLTVGELTAQNIEVMYTEELEDIGMAGMGLLGQNVFGQFDVTIKENVIKLRERVEQ
ncbi:retropepsin-like aspartic protease [Spirulina sp. CS-785/01]|uniref:retropepsin-like aspartic protease family protein n=1 Tax=Spirulina sp. CS-785/01 TaxID=3021716 RepID=UPI00232D2508|nr:retropepsin-like aspartic protease [Spirulina sp. CS-785/01]MDB9315474.1 retropepsin-like aspartic protease [Spirulina sp. CS-785/01]